MIILCFRTKDIDLLPNACDIVLENTSSNFTHRIPYEQTIYNKKIYIMYISSNIKDLQLSQFIYRWVE